MEFFAEVFFHFREEFPEECFGVVEYHHVVHVAEVMAHMFDFFHPMIEIGQEEVEEKLRHASTDFESGSVEESTDE